jgi:hypothetical protein
MVSIIRASMPMSMPLDHEPLNFRVPSDDVCGVMKCSWISLLILQISYAKRHDLSRNSLPCLLRIAYTFHSVFCYSCWLIII